jgi:hypothetical protein
MQLLLLVSVLAQTNPITLADYIPTRFVRYPGEYHGGWSPWNTVHRYQQEMNWWKQYLQ